MASERRLQERNHSAGRTVAALIGTVPPALGWGMALAVALPLPLDERLMVGTYAVFPLWVAATCCTFLAPTPRAAWGALGALLIVAALVVLIGLARVGTALS